MQASTCPSTINGTTNIVQTGKDDDEYPYYIIHEVKFIVRNKYHTIIVVDRAYSMLRYPYTSR